MKTTHKAHVLGVAAIACTLITLTATTGGAAPSPPIIPPANDNACNAIPVAIGSATAFTNEDATVQAGEPSPGPGTSSSTCNSTDGWCAFETDVQNSVWFKFVAPPCGSVLIEVLSLDYQLAVWQVGNCSNFATYTEIGANDDGGPVLAPLLDLCDLTPGQTYYVQVDGFNGLGSPGTIYVEEGSCGSNASCPGDTNCDGIVNSFDAVNVFFNFGTSGPTGDVNGDGFVNFFDYYIVIWNFGRVCR